MRFLFGFCFLAAAAGCAGTPTYSTATGDYLSGRLAVRKNAVGDAARSFGEAYGQAPQDVDLLRKAFFYKLAAGEVESAVDLAHRIVDQKVDDPDGYAQVLIGVAALKAGDYERARQSFTAEIGASYLKSAAYLADVWVEYALNGPFTAIPLLRPDARDDIFNGFNPLHIAFLSTIAGNEEQAGAAYQLSLLGLGGPVGREAYGAYLERRGDAEQVEEYYNLLAREAGPMRRLAEAGMARLAAGEPSQAYVDVTSIQGAAIGFFAFAGAILDRTLDERAKAEEAGFTLQDPSYNLPLALVQTALYLDPKLEAGHILAGQILNAYGDYAAAAEHFRLIPFGSPYFEDARIQLARAASANDEEERAIDLLKETVARDKSAVAAKLALGNLYASLERHDEAVTQFDAIITGLGDDELGEDAWRYFIARGASLLMLKRWPEAEADLKRAVAIAPEEATTLNYLGYSWAERGENLQEAFELIEKAVALEPHSGAIIDSLGWAYYQRGDYEAAVGYLEQAASKEPADPTITDHLGDVYWRLGRLIEARYQWRHALELDPDPALRAKLEKKIESGLADSTDKQSANQFTDNSAQVEK